MLFFCVALMDDALQIAKLDTNGDGKINKSEFVYFFSNSLTADPRYTHPIFSIASLFLWAHS